MNLDVCPRCNGKWKMSNYGRKCSTCRMILYGDDTSMWLALWLELYNAIHIRWGINEHTCEVHTLGRDGRIIVVPWLPFTIIKEELDKYLVLL
jgi:hypothetical protein